MKINLLRRLTAYTPAHKLSVLCALAGAVFSAGFSLLGPVLLGRAIDAVALADKAALIYCLLLFAGTVLVAAAFQWVMQAATRRLSAGVAGALRTEAFNRLQHVPLSTIDGHLKGDFTSRLVNDADAVAEGIMQGLGQLLPGVVTIAATVILMLLLHVRLAVLVILLTPLSVLVARFITLRTGFLFLSQSKQQGALTAAAGEMLTNQNLVQLFGYEAQSHADFEKQNEAYYKTNFQAVLYSSLINPSTRFITALVYVAVGVYGTALMVGGAVTVGGVSTFLAFTNQYSRPFNEISSVIAQVQAAFASAQRLFEVIDYTPEVPDAPDALPLAGSRGDVRMEEVYFSYTSAKPLIQGVSFHAKPGQRIALVGTTGCGKTTLINLLMRFYEVNAGVIWVDGTPAADICRDNLRGVYGMVLQDTWLKKATVYENIAYGRSDAPKDEIIRAAKAAYAHGFILRLPRGYDTLLESGGANLSAGQRQLLCLARVMLAKPDILILDEATSSIDTRTEQLVQKALAKLMEGHTSFIVAHRLSTIQTADCILVMDAGKIIERGTHEELLHLNGHYAEVYNSQFKQS